DQRADKARVKAAPGTGDRRTDGEGQHLPFLTADSERGGRDLVFADLWQGFPDRGANQLVKQHVSQQRKASGQIEKVGEIIEFNNLANLFYLTAGFALLTYMLLDQLVRSPIGETLPEI